MVQIAFPFLKTLLENKSLTFRANNQDGTCYIDALGSDEYYSIIANIDDPYAHGSIQIYARISGSEPVSFVGTETIKEYLDHGKYRNGDTHAIQC
jgi:hypothetical protein